MATTQDPLAWEDNYAVDSKRSKKKRKTEEEMGWEDNIKSLDRNGVWRFAEGSGRKGKEEMYCCYVICVQGLGTEMR